METLDEYRRVIRELIQHYVSDALRQIATKRTEGTEGI
jgi:hypothetical protein